jgi:hypothetical protein
MGYPGLTVNKIEREKHGRFAHSSITRDDVGDIQHRLKKPGHGLDSIIFSLFQILSPLAGHETSPIGHPYVRGKISTRRRLQCPGGSTDTVLRAMDAAGDIEKCLFG